MVPPPVASGSPGRKAKVCHQRQLGFRRAQRGPHLQGVFELDVISHLRALKPVPFTPPLPLLLGTNSRVRNLDQLLVRVASEV